MLLLLTLTDILQYMYTYEYTYGYTLIFASNPGQSGSPTRPVVNLMWPRFPVVCQSNPIQNPSKTNPMQMPY